MDSKIHGNRCKEFFKTHPGTGYFIDGWLRMRLLPPIGNFADISYLVEN